jgi:hypothetical protein
MATAIQAALSKELDRRERGTTTKHQLSRFTTITRFPINSTHFTGRWSVVTLVAALFSKNCGLAQGLLLTSQRADGNRHQLSSEEEANEHQR